MVIRPAKIQFTEPTVIAFSGALFDVTVGDKTLSANRMYILDRGDVLTFHSSERGGRVYLAVAGGIKKSGRNVLESGDELTMRRNYTEQHRSEEHTSELQSRFDLVCRLLLAKKK